MNKVILKKFVLTSLVLIFIFGVIFIFVQQSLRRNANNPQAQIAKNSAVVLAKGEEPEFMRKKAGSQINMAKSSDTFLITYDGVGNPLASTGMLNGKMPAPPAGVFDYAKKHGENKLTWQPAKGVRIAAVLVYYGGAREGFALSGRSLLGVEKRESLLEKIVIFSILASIFIAFIGFFVVGRRKGLTP